MSDQPKHTPGPLQYVEGDLITIQDMQLNRKGKRACWLADAEGEAICVVSQDADFERARVHLQHAAYATQILPKLLAACKTALEWAKSDRTLLDWNETVEPVLDIAITEAEGGIVP